mmetsp:Transcript_22501/g.70408  ORF Transcript_22501/g.70408 Transcript_22501/m.70408 type:complete len:100 (+) Transcript_22501:2367-2666(+)
MVASLSLAIRSAPSSSELRLRHHYSHRKCQQLEANVRAPLHRSYSSLSLHIFHFVQQISVQASHVYHTKFIALWQQIYDVRSRVWWNVGHNAIAKINTA